jgi:hypothetical protein
MLSHFAFGALHKIQFFATQSHNTKFEPFQIKFFSLRCKNRGRRTRKDPTQESLAPFSGRHAAMDPWPGPDPIGVFQCCAAQTQSAPGVLAMRP